MCVVRVSVCLYKSPCVCFFVKLGFPAASGALVISAYAVCPDITATVTPDLEDPDGKGISHTLKQYCSKSVKIFSFFHSFVLSLLWQREDF